MPLPPLSLPPPAAAEPSSATVRFVFASIDDADADAAAALLDADAPAATDGVPPTPRCS
jgi:hypothetical protein